MSRAKVELIPWDPKSPDHVTRMIDQRIACGWASDLVPQWQENQRTGFKCIYWLVSFYLHKGGAIRVAKHSESLRLAQLFSIPILTVMFHRSASTNRAHRYLQMRILSERQGWQSTSPNTPKSVQSQPNQTSPLPCFSTHIRPTGEESHSGYSRIYQRNPANPNRCIIPPRRPHLTRHRQPRRGAPQPTDPQGKRLLD